VQIKNRQQLLAIVAISVVGLFAADKLVRAPLTASWQQRARQISALRDKVADGRNWVQRDETLRNRWQRMRSSTLPTNPSLAEQQVVKALDRWCRESGITRDSFTPQWKRDSDDYTTLQCRIETSGNINAITRFLYGIESDPMALRLENVELSSRDNEGQQLILGLQLSALVLTPQEKRQ
jgi:Tfp pilus assembly protein PilO